MCSKCYEPATKTPVASDLRTRQIRLIKRVWELVKAQGRKGTVDTPDARTKGGCRFRSKVPALEKNEPKTTLKCAIGVLIPDDYYYPALENISPKNFPPHLFELMQVGEDLVPLLSQLQLAHDRATTSPLAKWIPLPSEPTKPSCNLEGCKSCPPMPPTVQKRDVGFLKQFRANLLKIQLASSEEQLTEQALPL